jgi:hypothetical protein
LVSISFRYSNEVNEDRTTPHHYNLPAAGKLRVTGDVEGEKRKEEAMRVSIRRLGLVWCLSAFIMSGCGKAEEPKPPITGAQPIAAAQPATQSKKQSQEPIAAKLGKLGVKVQVKSEDDFLVTEGFPYQKDLKGNDVIEIVNIAKGVFTAAEKSNVPTEMMGMVYLVAGGSFIPKCNAKEGTRTYADSVGNTWIFKQSGMEFNVYMPGSTNLAFTVRSKANGATISFTEEGVLLKGFALRPSGEQ